MTDYLKHKNDFNTPEFAAVFDELTFWSSRFGQLLFNHLEIRGGLEILDVGCASGFPLFELAGVFGNSCHVTGLDIWREAITRAGTKLKFHNATNVSIVEANGAQQPFRDAVFDLIVSNLGLNNWSRPQSVLWECFRVAKHDARLVLTTNIEGHFKEFYDVFRETLRERNRPEQLEKLHAQAAHRGTLESLSELLREASWTPVRVVEDHFDMRFLNASALLNHTLTKIGFLDGWRSVVGVDEERETFEAIERKLDEIASASGELRMTVPMLYLEAAKAT